MTGIKPSIDRRNRQADPATPEPSGDPAEGARFGLPTATALVVGSVIDTAALLGGTSGTTITNAPSRIDDRSANQATAPVPHRSLR